MDKRASGLTDRGTGRSEEELGKHEEETEDADATADEDGAEEENAHWKKAGGHPTTYLEHAHEWPRAK